MGESINLEDLLKLVPKLPSGVIKLPSRGVFYDKEVIPNGTIEITPLTGRTEKLMAGLRGNNVDDIIDTILERHMVTKIEPKELLASDRFYILVSLRAQSYGEDYDFELACPSCEVKARYAVRLPSDFTVQYSEPEDKEPFDIILPSSKLRVSFRLLRGKDETAIKNFSEKEAKTGFRDGDPAYSYRLATCITAVNGKPFADLYTAMQFVEKIPAKDAATLSDAIDKKTPGLLLSVTKECVACKKEIEAGMPITAEFFRPRSFLKKIPDGNAVVPNVQSPPNVVRSR